MAAEKTKDMRGETVGGVAVSQKKRNARMNEKCATKTGIEKTKDIQRDYEETVQALKRIKEIWNTLNDNEKKMMRIIKRALMQKERKLRKRLKEGC